MFSVLVLFGSSVFVRSVSWLSVLCVCGSAFEDLCAQACAQEGAQLCIHKCTSAQLCTGERTAVIVRLGVHTDPEFRN